MVPAVWRFIKLLLWVIPVLLVAGAIGLFLWYKRDIYAKEQKVGTELKEIRTAKVDNYDFGLEKFDAAVALLREGKDEEARKAILNMLRFHRDSARAKDAMRLLGQMNLDRLLDPDQAMPGKKKVEIERGGSLNKLAVTHQTTWHYIVRANGLSKPDAIQPNEQVWVCPLNYRVVIDTGAKQLLLMDGDLFFALFPIKEIRRPPTGKLPIKATIGQKFGVLDSKRVLLTEDSALRAEKWIEIGRDWAIRSVARGAEPGQGFGIFLSEADADDLLTILRTGNAVEINP
jgi:hypothetical protein